MYVSLYRRYRPQKFSDMVGQGAAVRVLQESLKEGRLGHAYLFSGPRGCGKTSAARLVAKSLNCLDRSEDFEPCGKCDSCTAIARGEHLDVIEIDGASNRGINEIRDLKTRVNLKPLSAKYKVYIIDEVHMLTEPAFNALLKTLEEPPANVVFLLATTEPYKVPVTIRSRCQHIPFHRISIADMVKRVLYVCGEEKIEAEQEAAWEIARQADGALRDALSITEQAIALGEGKLTLSCVRELMGGSSRTELEKWITLLRTDPKGAADVLHDMLARGISMERFTESLFAIFRDLWIYSLWGDAGIHAIEISDTEYEYIKNEAVCWTPDKLKSACMRCNAILPRTRYGMRLEVFSGLMLMELMDSAAGRTQQAVRPREAPAAVSRALEPRQVSFSAPQNNARHASPEIQAEPVNHTVPAEKPAVPAPVPAIVMSEISDHYDSSELCDALGENPLAGIISSLGHRQLQIGAALLDATIEKDGENGIKLSYPSESFSNDFMNIPANMMLLTDAAQKLWGIKKTENNAENSEPPVPATPLDTPAAAQPPSQLQMTQEQEARESVVLPSGADRLLKLMGAEVLYVKDNGFNAAEENESEERR